MGIFVYQGDEEGCGLASLKMLLLDLTKKKGYRYLTSDKEEDLSLEDIRQMAFKEGVDIKWKRCSKEEDLLTATTFPLLILLKGEGKGHLVYLKKAKKGRFLVYDPAIGKKWLKKEELVKDYLCARNGIRLVRILDADYPETDQCTCIRQESESEEALEEALKAAFHIIGIHLDINLQRDRDIIYGCFQRWKQIRKTQL